MRPSAHAIDSDAATLTRHTTGLSPAHVELIKLLAAAAVNQYFDEMAGHPVIEGGQ